MVPSRPRYADLLARLESARSAGVLLGLDRTREVLERLGNPQRAAIAVQIAGTNGKGSTAAMTDAILRAAGLRTGLYTSPHLSRFTERIRVDGTEVDGDRLADLDREIQATGIPLTYFEIATALAFRTFAEEAVDVMVLETGLGGRLDATTACAPVATAISSIGWDHAELLGPTLAAIAGEKAGIAKPGVPLFLGPVVPEADQAIAEIAARVGAPVRRFGTDFAAPPVALGLPGDHQISNAALAVALADTAARAAGRTVEPHAIESGLRDVRWPGRLEWVGGNLLLDCAHNAEGATALASALAAVEERTERGRRPRALVFSVVGGKPAVAMLRILARRFDAIYLTHSSNPRSLTADALLAMVSADVDVNAPVEGHAGHAANLGNRTIAIADSRAALAAARERVGADGLVVVAGSTFLVGDLRAELLGESRDPVPTSDPISAPGPSR